MFSKRWRIIRTSKAIILGISKALISHDESLKEEKDKLTTRDSRVVERKIRFEKLEEASSFLEIII